MEIRAHNDGSSCGWALAIRVQGLGLWGLGVLESRVLGL